MSVSLRIAQARDLDRVLAYVRAYHAFEGVSAPEGAPEAALRGLLGEGPFGRLWLVCLDGEPIGYVALCFGYAIEFGGRDGFVDEIFLEAAHRGRGHGRAVFALLETEARSLGLEALHLEVARGNARARRLYRSAGFDPRERYFLMSRRLEERA